MAKRPEFIGSHKRTSGGLLQVRAHPHGYEIVWSHPSGDPDLHGGKVTCDELALRRYLHAECGHPDPDGD